MENKIIKFHEATLVAFSDNAGNNTIAIRPICEAIGIEPDRAIKSIRKNAILAEEVSIQTLQAAPNEQKREFVCLPLHLVNGWLFSINANFVSDQARPALLMYQKECYKVLFNHFYGRTKHITTNLRRQYEIDSKLHEINTQINVLMSEHKQLTRERKALVKNNYAQLGLEFSDVETTDKSLQPFHKPIELN